MVRDGMKKMLMLMLTLESDDTRKLETSVKITALSLYIQLMLYSVQCTLYNVKWFSIFRENIHKRNQTNFFISVFQFLFLISSSLWIFKGKGLFSL